jgi:RNA polymerase-binding transcription factor DksA
MLPPKKAFGNCKQLGGFHLRITMTNTELELYRRQLRVRQNRNIDESHLTDKALVTSSGQASGLVPLSIYRHDLATKTFEQQIVKEVAAALDRIELGTFGYCEECGKTIPVGRLEVLPYTRFCVECARKPQRGPPQAGNPFREADYPSEFQV